MARGRGFGFEEDEMPGFIGRRIPREDKPMQITTRTRAIEIRLQRLLGFTNRPEEKR